MRGLLLLLLFLLLWFLDINVAIGVQWAEMPCRDSNGDRMFNDIAKEKRREVEMMTRNNTMKNKMLILVQASELCSTQNRLDTLV